MIRCTYCVMDTTDPDIFFDSAGRCNHCSNPLMSETKKSFFHQSHWINQIQLDKKTQKSHYDAIVGVSGGVDSSFLVHYLKQFDLNLLLVHVDAGWNSSTATLNIKKIIESANLDLLTVVIDWNEMKDLQIAYLRSGVMNQDVPQDHAFFATLFKKAKELGIKNIITGTNSATESIRVPAWSHDAMDGRNLNSIYRQFGNSKELKKIPVIAYPEFYYETYLKKSFRILRPLEQIDYRKKIALKTLQEKYNWKDYGGKHRESMFTKFFQDVYLVNRYGIDKRIIHLSDLIINGELTREEALNELSQPASTKLEQANLIRFVASKLDLDEDELNRYMKLPPSTFANFPNDKWFLDLISFTSKSLKKIGIRRKFLK